MNRNRSLFRVLPLALLAGLLASFLTSSCACEAGQLTASEIAPLVETVADDLEAYLETGLAPDGSELSDARALQYRGGVVVLRNAVRVAMGEEPLELPSLEPTPDPDDGETDG
ncbi:MAG: hypothetical protein AAFP86_09900, partial [Planctomycetota bacterium]